MWCPGHLQFQCSTENWRQTFLSQLPCSRSVASKKPFLKQVEDEVQYPRLSFSLYICATAFMNQHSHIQTYTYTITQSQTHIQSHTETQTVTYGSEKGNLGQSLEITHARNFWLDNRMAGNQGEVVANSDSPSLSSCEELHNPPPKS